MIDFDIKNNSNNMFYDLYEIKEGDSLYKVSKLYNVNTKLLAELNGLDLDDYIYSGQMLLIPKKDVSYYITKEGDTLSGISRLFGVKDEELINQNKTIYLQNGQMIFFKRD
jgi:LysM repeat protein